jgi:branched-chain amino acid aminotransferase
MESFLPIAYFEKQFLPFVEAKLSIATQALHYGTGSFGGIRGIPAPNNPKEILLFRLERHCQRFCDSAKFLHYDLDLATVKTTLIELIQKNQPKTAFYLRPFVYVSGLGIAPRLHQITKDFLVYGLEMGDYLSPEGVNCRISSWCRQEDRSLPLRGKVSGAYITSALAKTEAVESGFDEAILLNSQGNVCEASGMNIFLVRRGALITPSVDQDLLEGITRESILTLAKDLGIETIERPVNKSELFIADEVFLCGTAAKVLPVQRIENYRLPAHRPITQLLQTKLATIVQKQDPYYQDWVDTISLQSPS